MSDEEIEENRVVRPVPDLLRQRRTIRAVSPEPVPPEMIDTLLEAACLAPSAHNRQPWRFVVVEDLTARSRLAHAMADAFRRDLRADGRSDVEIEERVGGSVARLCRAPVLVVACLDPADLDLYGDHVRQEAEHTLGVQSVAAAIQNLLLAATDADLAAGWMCAPLFCQDLVRRDLGLPSSWEPQALITIGWPAEAVMAPPRAPLATRVVRR
jgi:coenzyme F420-0:L-glutamate ligase / coenzyme F420-1:gamma-L-glutamate ligase